MPIQKSIIFFIRILPVFLARVRPASHKAKPACIKNTRNAATSVQVTSAELYITDSPLSLCTAPPRTMRHCILQPTTKGAGRELAIPSGAFAVCCVAAMIALSAPTVKGNCHSLLHFVSFGLQPQKFPLIFMHVLQACVFCTWSALANKLNFAVELGQIYGYVKFFAKKSTKIIHIVL